MTTEEIKTKKAQIKTIVKEYEVQLEAAQGEPVPEGGAKGDVLPEGPQAMDIDDAKGTSKPPQCRSFHQLLLFEMLL